MSNQSQIFSQEDKQKRICTAEKKALIRMNELGIRVPPNFLPEDIASPDWTSIIENDPKMVYFKNEERRKGLGAQGLVYSAIYDEEIMPKSLVFHEDDIRLHLKIAQLLNTCSRAQRGLIADVISLVENSTKRSLEMSAKEKLNFVIDGNNHIPPLPTTNEALRREFQSNKYSLLNNLPCPKVDYCKKHDIALVCIEDCLRDFLAHGIEFSTISKSTMNPELAALLQENTDADVVMRYVNPSFIFI
jgi:hypothetical protein